jgi:hypothetical protein
MAIDPKTRSPKHYETGKEETLSRSYPCLVHSTWARWWRSLLPQVEAPFLIVLASTCLMKTTPHIPTYPIMGEPCLAPSSWSIASFNQKISSEMDHIELALQKLLKVLINLDFVLCTLTWSTLHFIFFLHNNDVLKMHMRAHSILFFKIRAI